MRSKPFERKLCLNRVAFWLRSCQDDETIGNERVLRRYVNKAREAMDELMLDMFGDEQESEETAVEKEGVA